MIAGRSRPAPQSRRSDHRSQSARKEAARVLESEFDEAHYLIDGARNGSLGRRILHRDRDHDIGLISRP